MTALEARRSVQKLLGVVVDGKIGKNTRTAFERLASAPDEAEWPPLAAAVPTIILKGDGSYPWTAQIDGPDIVVYDARATCFGGSDDPQDSGETASGISTKANPDIMACSLPMNYTGPNAPTRRALIGSPIPMLPWKTSVRVSRGEEFLIVPVIDLGPAKTTGNALDLTIAAARFFNPKATARNFEMRCDYRILGGAKFA